MDCEQNVNSFYLSNYAGLASNVITKCIQKGVANSNGKNDEENSKKEAVVNPIADRRDPLSNAAFRSHLLERFGRTLKMVNLFSPSLEASVVKPQRLLTDHNEYYMALDMLTRTYYISYKRLMMIDIDFYKDENLTLESLREAIAKFAPNEHFLVYKSRNGLHAFMISRYANFHNDGDLQLMLDLGCDFYYTVYTSIRGWCVRLNRKKGEKEGQRLYSFLCEIGNGPILTDLRALVYEHLMESAQLSFGEVCMMRGD